MNLAQEKKDFNLSSRPSVKSIRYKTDKSIKPTSPDPLHPLITQKFNDQKITVQLNHEMAAIKKLIEDYAQKMKSL